MSRKSSTITLSILAAVAALGACCCCADWSDPDRPVGGHSGGRPGFIFFGGGSSHTTGPSGTGSSTTSRGGFGSTAGSGTGVGA